MSDLSRDELRRALRGIDADHAQSMVSWKDAVRRIFSDPTVSHDPAATRTAITIGGLSRRRMLSVAGLSIASGAVLAACGKDKPASTAGTPLSGEAKPKAAAPKVAVDDIVLLRTASSLEHLAADTYLAAIDSGLLSTPALVAAAQLFMAHHLDHAQAFEAATVSLGGEAYTSRNPVVWDAVVKPSLFGSAPTVTDEGSAVRFAHTLENVAADTYQSVTIYLRDQSLRQAAMSVGGVESRHAATLAGVIAQLGLVQGSASVPELSDGASEDVDNPPVFQVPGALGSVASAIGPNSFMVVASAE